MNYLSKTLRGFFWISALSGTIRILALAKIAVLARILLPSQFGEFAIVTMVLAFLEIVTETGVNLVLLQDKDSLDKYVDTAWIVSILRGLLIAALVVLAASPIAAFFNVSSARNLLMLAAWVPVLRGFINPACIKFLKELRFATEFWYRLSIVTVEIGLTAVIALSTKSAVSLVLGMVGAAGVEVVLSWMFITPRPTGRWDYSQAKMILNRGKWVTGFGLFDYVFTTADNVVVGKLLGSSALGIYQNAYKLALLPGTQVNDIYFKTTTPVYIKMLDEERQLTKAVLIGISGLLAIQIVVSFALFFGADWIVRLALGTNWLAAIPVVRVLAILGLVRGVLFSCNSLFIAKHKQKYSAVIAFVSMAGIVALLIPWVHNYGLIGAAYAAVVGGLLGLPIMLFLAVKTIRNL